MGEFGVGTGFSGEFAGEVVGGEFGDFQEVGVSEFVGGAGSEDLEERESGGDGGDAGERGVGVAEFVGEEFGGGEVAFGVGEDDGDGRARAGEFGGRVGECESGFVGFKVPSVGRDAEGGGVSGVGGLPGVSGVSGILGVSGCGGFGFGEGGMGSVAEVGEGGFIAVAGGARGAGGGEGPRADPAPDGDKNKIGGRQGVGVHRRDYKGFNPPLERRDERLK